MLTPPLPNDSLGIRKDSFHHPTITESWGFCSQSGGSQDATSKMVRRGEGHTQLNCPWDYLVNDIPPHPIWNWGIIFSLVCDLQASSTYLSLLHLKNFCFDSFRGVIFGYLCRSSHTVDCIVSTDGRKMPKSGTHIWPRIDFFFWICDSPPSLPLAGSWCKPH